MPWTDDEFLDFYNRLPPHELTDVEFKSGLGFGDLRFRATVIKAVLAMSNLPDGGRVLLGPNDDRSSIGWSPAAAKASWSADRLADVLHSHASEAPRISLLPRAIGAEVLLEIDVSPFDLLPTVCKVTYEDILTKGVTYIRPFSGRPRSVAAVDPADVRRLHEAFFARELARLRRMGVDPLPERTSELARRERDFFGA